MGFGSWGARAPNGEQSSVAERDVLLWGEETYALSPLVDLTGLDAASRAGSSRDMLGRRREENIGEGVEIRAEGGAGAGGGGIRWGAGLHTAGAEVVSAALVLQQLVQQWSRCGVLCGKRYER